ncbi:MAG: bifunctional diguanylate cyclase/phosphodiesterase [Rhodocyclaceae bacterium]|nr:bifunctional diguanylate cyclase/phosphodiesterase [Rhodocyclaceae bacterium]
MHATADSSTDPATLALAQRWIPPHAVEGDAAMLGRLLAHNARTLGQRTRAARLWLVVGLATLLALGGLIDAGVPAALPALPLLLLPALACVRLGRALRDGEVSRLARLTQRYRRATTWLGLIWGSLVAILVVTAPHSTVTELGLVATLGLVVGAFAILAIERSLWLRFSLAIWTPILTATAIGMGVTPSDRGSLLALELLFAAWSTLQGLWLTREHTRSHLTRWRLEEAIQTLEARDHELTSVRSQQNSLELRSRQLTHFDQLTQLGSRLHLHERLEDEVARYRERVRPFALLILDIKGFRDINGSLGTAAGDEVLRSVARRITETQRSGDFAARQGNDEFAVLMRDVSDAEAVRIADRFHQAIEEPLRIGSRLICPHVAIGVAICPTDSLDTAGLLAAAENAVQVALRLPQFSSIRYVPGMSAAAMRRLTIEQELMTALAEDQLVLHFQPQVDARDLRIIGVEALVRWHHPTRGQIPPLEFIPVAENTGLIDALGEWVLDAACRQAVAWRERGLEFGTMAVNISPLQLRDPRFVDKIDSVLRRSGLQAEGLELEITESAVQTQGDTCNALARLRDRGIRIALDDFGTGYSSLASLRALQVDRIKIDRAFVGDMLQSPRSAALLGTMADMAHALDATVVAEGVEQAEQASALSALGCDSMQGYFFSRPVDAASLAKVLDHGIALADPLLGPLQVDCRAST